MSLEVSKRWARTIGSDAARIVEHAGAIERSQRPSEVRRLGDDIRALAARVDRAAVAVIEHAGRDEGREVC